MGSRLVVCGVLLFTASAFGGANDKEKPALENRFEGTWVAENAPNRLLTRLVVSRDDRGWWVEILAVRGLKEEPVQKAALLLLHDGPGKTPVVRGLAIWKEGSAEGTATLYATLKPSGADMVLELSKVYAEPKYTNWVSTFPLKKDKP